MVLVLDALNHLEDRFGALDLVWLPKVIPENVRILLSSLPGRPLEELRRRGWPSLTVEPLQPQECQRLIRDYLALFTKTLAAGPMERIAAAEQCRNPLFLRLLLDELRLFGRHEELGWRINRCLAAQSIPELYQVILERCEQDYGQARPGLVRDSLAMLWAARRGLSESELMELLGQAGQPLPRLYWSPLFLALEQSLVNRSGLIGFFHDYLRQAVQARYLPGPPEQELAHLDLAAYFWTQPVFAPRRLDELPWQLVQAGQWQRLYSLLADLDFFNAAWDYDSYEVKTRWVELEGHSTFRLLEAYRPVLEQPDQHLEHAMRISTFLADTGYNQEDFNLAALSGGPLPSIRRFCQSCQRPQRPR